MKKISVIGMFMGAVLLAPMAFAGDQSSMSDTQHRKTMSGMHHPEHSHDADVKEGHAAMSNSQHRKTMSGMSHPKHGDDGKKLIKKEKATMSNAQHRKTMGGMSHPNKD